MNKTIIALALATASLSASAAPVDTWFYGISTQWDSAKFTTSGTGTKSQTATQISWGGSSDSQRSSLAISDAPFFGWKVGTIDTNGFAGDANDITHTNNAISSSFATLISGEMGVNVGLSPLVLPSAYFPLSYAFSFKFFETANNGNCRWSNGNANKGKDCDDIFVFAGDTSKSFTYAGETYVASLGFDEKFIALTSDQCGKFFQSGSGCFALITDEGAKTTGSMNLSVSRNSVPEPGTLALLGASLIGFAAVRRRKTA